MFANPPEFRPLRIYNTENCCNLINFQDYRHCTDYQFNWVSVLFQLISYGNYIIYQDNFNIQFSQLNIKHPMSSAWKF